jgi:hypothetical protein
LTALSIGAIRLRHARASHRSRYAGPLAGSSSRYRPRKSSFSCCARQHAWRAFR